MSAEVVEDSIELWIAISERAGLQEHGYDADLVSDVKASLGVPQSEDLSTALSGVSVESLLHAVLEALRPFSCMLSDLLALYEWVGATAADDPNLRIRYVFGADAADGYAFDLDSFREHEERWASTTSLAPDLSIGPEALWDLSTSLSAVPRSRAGRTIETSLHHVYDQGGTWPDRLPELPVTDDPGLGAVLAEAFEVASEVLAQSRALSSGPEELVTRLLDEDVVSVEGPIRRTLLGIHQDHWLAILDEQARNAAAHRWADTQEREGFIRGLKASLAAIPRVEVSQQQLIDEVLDVLSLPVWGKRYELYSAWLLTLIVEALGRRHCRFHVVEGVLSFSFGGSHLASIDTAAGQLELWAELRHPYATPIGRGRKRAVQPDYTLTRPPFDAATSAVLAVEAKQYGRSSRKNFYGALVDYTGAHLSAHVLLANYGPMSPSLLKSPPDRSSAFGYVRPGRDVERSAFVDRIRAVVPVPSPMPAGGEPAARVQPTHVANARMVVVLHWSSGLDLDLHLVAADTGATTNYRSLPSAGADDPVRLWNDDMSAPGVEIAHILEGAGPVAVWVHRFSGEDDFADMGATVHVLRSGTPTPIIVKAPPQHSSVNWWNVGLVGGDGSWETVNRSSVSGPVIADR